MPTTTPDALPYPDPSARPDVPYWVQALAERLQAVLSTDRARRWSGTVTATTDASGYATLAHGAGRVPVQVHVQSQGPMSGSTVASQVVTGPPTGEGAWTAGSVKVRVFTPSGAVVASTSVTFSLTIV